MSESWLEVLQINIREMKRLEIQHPEFADELKLIIALGNENLKRNGLYPRIISILYIYYTIYIILYIITP